MVKFGVGQPIRRVEDQRFLTGTGRYTDDVNLPGQAYAYILRSFHAHADFALGDLPAARKAPGVRAVLTGADYQADGLKSMPCKAPVKNRDGKDQVLPPRWPLAVGTVRHVGDPVALIVAATPAQARDAAELIETVSPPALGKSRISSRVRIPPPTVSGIHTTAAVRRTTSSMISRPSWLAVMSKNTNSSAPSCS